jgi:uncharacterized protein
MDNPIQVDLGRVAQDLQIRRLQVESVVQLLDDGNTVPFITRYRKEQTGNLNEVVINEIKLRVQRLRDLAERKETILKAIEAQGKLNPDLAAAIRAADNPKRLEDLYLPFKPKKRTKASDARERGLEPLAFRIWTRDDTLQDVNAAALEFVNAEKGVDTVEKVLEGVGHILAEAISEMATLRDAVRRVVWKTGKMVTVKGEVAEGQGLDYRDYFEYSEPVAQIPPHRILAINRGDKENALKVKLEVSRPDVESALYSQLPLEGHPQGDLFRAAAIDALDRLILPSMEREIRRDLTEGAEKHAVDVFARNLRSLLLQPPIPSQVVMAIDPGFRTGCKVVVLDGNGNLLDQKVIFPHPPQNRRSDAKVALKDLVGKHSVGVVAIGNGTACRETEELIAEIIAEGTRFTEQGLLPAPPSAEPAPAPEPAKPEAAEETQAAEAEPAAPEAEAAAPVEEPEPAIVDEVVEPGSHVEPTETHEPAPSFAAPDESVAESAIPAANHQSEMPIESLPPISGGSPESTPSEADVNTNSTEPQLASNGDHPSGDLHAGTPPPQESAAPETTAVAEKPPVEEHTPPPSTEEPADFSPVPTVSVEAASISEGQSPSLSDTADYPTPPETASGLGGATETAAASVEPTPTSDLPPTPESTPAPDAPAQKPTPPTGKGNQQGRGPKPGGGQGRSESRSRSRNKQSAPAGPQAPPAPHAADKQLAQLAYVIVNEAGASVYSTSQVGRDELPDFDATVRSGISIGRRLQDPLSELVKIEPQNIGVGLYQHDVNPKQLKETLESVISSCVNFVGVDLNTASVPLLRHVSGLNQLTARRIVDFRTEHGSFTNREQLTKVEGIGPASFTQAAGFLKVRDGEHPLDRTWVHPESYPAAIALLEKFGFTPDIVGDKARLPELHAKLADADVPALAAELSIGEFSLRDIIEALGRPERDPRDDLPKPIFKKGVLKLEDLVPGMELKGTVLNVVDFGAFVDIGLKDSGLVHISQLANRYVKSPHDVVSVGDVVTAWVMGVDQERKRVSLTMVKPGTERQRGPQAGPGPGGGQRRGGEQQRGPRPPQGQEGQGGRGGPRPPRPAASTLTSPPVGSPSVAVLAEAPLRNPPERDRGDSGRGRPSAPREGGGGGYADRGGPRHGQDSGRGRPAPDSRGPAPRPAPRPARPSAPPPPLSKDALAGAVPLRTFGQLKQLWEARVDPLPGEPGHPDTPGSPQSEPPAQETPQQPPPAE